MKQSKAWDFLHVTESETWRTAEIECPVARRIIEDVRQYIPMGTYRGPALDDPVACPPSIHKYQAWLRLALARSGLAVGLAGGPAFLPEINEHMPRFLRFILNKLKPRNHSQLARHIINNLEWYVDQRHNIRTPWFIMRELIMPTVLITGLFYGALLVSTGILKYHWVLQIGIVSLLLSLVSFLMHVLGRGSHKHRTNCAEFHRYLMIAYAEPGERLELEIAEGVAKGVSEIRGNCRLSPMSENVQDQV